MQGRCIHTYATQDVVACMITVSLNTTVSGTLNLTVLCRYGNLGVC